jgi:prepilin-type processing-associated H-X9-DG protein
MSSNRKLTPILTGRTIQSIEQAENLLNILFADGSSMKIKTSSPAANLDLQNRKVLKVRQAGTVMNLDFDDESTMEIPLAEATSSVMLRDGKGALEYAD